MGIDEEFDRFVKASFVGLCRTGYLICGDRQRAEDAAQEALLRAHRQWRRVSNPLAYTRRALSTILIDQSRRPWRREVPTESSPERPLADESGESETPVLYRNAVRLFSTRKPIVVAV